MRAISIQQFTVKEAGGVTAGQALIQGTNLDEVILPTGDNQTGVGIAAIDGAFDDFINVIVGGFAPVQYITGDYDKGDILITEAANPGRLIKADLATFTDGSFVNIFGIAGSDSPSPSDNIGCGVSLLLERRKVVGGTVLLGGSGGTGITSYAVGDMLYASGATTLAKTTGYLFWDNTNKALCVSNTGDADDILSLASPADIHVRTDGAVTHYGTLWEHCDDSNSYFPRVAFAKARGNLGAKTTVADTDILGVIQPFGYDGSDYISETGIQFVVDGTPGAADVPTKIVIGSGASKVEFGSNITVTGNVTAISGLTASRAVVTDGSKGLASSATTATEIGYVNGVTSAIQTQLDAKATAGAALTEVAEAATSPVADDSDIASTASVRYYAFFTLPTTEKWYIITGIEWKNGATVSGNITAGIDYVDADPPTLVQSPLAAWSAFTVAAGASAVQRTSLVSSVPIRGGSILGAFIKGNGTHTFRFLTGAGSQNQERTAEAHSADLPLGTTAAWTAATRRAYIKVYYRGIK